MAANQTEKLRRARWEFIRRNSDKKKELDEIIERHEKWMRGSEIMKSQGALVEIRDRLDAPEFLNFNPTDDVKACLQPPAAKEASLHFFQSWWRCLGRINPFRLSYEEKQAAWRAQILKDAPAIMDRMLPVNPSECLILTVDLTRTKEAILEEIEAIVTEQKKAYDEATGERSRLKWLPKTSELLQVWDLYEKAGQTPIIKSFALVASQMGRPLSTVKSQWYTAYEKIYGEKYDPESVFSTEEKRSTADALCARCPHSFKCYRKNGDWVPCADFLRLAGKERRLETYDDARYHHDDDAYEGYFQETTK